VEGTEGVHATEAIQLFRDDVNANFDVELEKSNFSLENVSDEGNPARQSEKTIIPGEKIEFHTGKNYK